MLPQNTLREVKIKNSRFRAKRLGLVGQINS